VKNNHSTKIDAGIWLELYNRYVWYRSMDLVETANIIGTVLTNPWSGEKISWWKNI